MNYYTNYPPRRRRSRRRSSSHLHSLLFLFLFFLILRPVSGDADTNANGNKESKKENMRGPSLAERAVGIAGLDSRWDAIRTWAKLACMNLRPPASTYGQGSDSASVATEAAVRSFETVEQSAASAAKAAGEAVERTTEKLKRTLSSERDTNAEL